MHKILANDAAFVLVDARAIQVQRKVFVVGGTANALLERVSFHRASDNHGWRES